MKDISKQELNLIIEALEISKSFKVYGDGREKHQAECQYIINKLKENYEKEI